MYVYNLHIIVIYYFFKTITFLEHYNQIKNAFQFSEAVSKNFTEALAHLDKKLSDGEEFSLYLRNGFKRLIKQAINL